MVISIKYNIILLSTKMFKKRDVAYDAPSITFLKPNMYLVCDNVLVAGYESFKNIFIPLPWFL